MATKDYDAMIRKAIQSGNYAVDTPKSVLQEMFPDLAQWRLDRLGMENLSEDTQSYINSPFSTIDNMDTSLMNYGTQDTFSYNRMNPASLQMQSVTELPYDPSTLNTVYQSPPPLQGPQPFVGRPEFNTTNYEPDLSTLQIADSLPYDSSTLNTVYESLPPIQGPQTPSEYYSNLKGWGRNPFVSEEFVETEEGLVSKKWMEPATEPIVAQANTPLSNVSTGNVQNEIPVSTGIGRDSGNFISANVLDELQNISSVPSGTMSASDPSPTPNPWMQVANQSQNMNLDTMDEAQRGIVERAMRSGQPAQVPTGVMADAVPSDATAISDLNFDFGNALQGGIMVGTNLASLGKYDEAIDDIESAIDEVGTMSGTAIEDANRKGAELQEIMMTGIESQADSVNQKLKTSMDKLNNNPKNVVGNFKNTSIQVRKTLQDSLDSTINIAQSKLDSQMSTLADSRRDTLAYLDSQKEELRSKIEEMEKEKEEAKWGAAVGVGSILADSVLPGSGQALRTGWNMYSSRT